MNHWQKKEEEVEDAPEGSLSNAHRDFRVFAAHKRWQGPSTIAGSWGAVVKVDDGHHGVEEDSGTQACINHEGRRTDVTEQAEIKEEDRNPHGGTRNYVQEVDGVRLLQE